MKIFLLLLLYCQLGFAAVVTITQEEQRRFQDTSFLVSAPWRIEDKGDWLKFSLPEGDLEMALMILPHQGKPEALLAKAWQKFRPGFNRTVELTNRPPAAGGWESFYKVSYEVPLQESRAVVGQYSVLKGKAYIILLDAKAATLEKRGAQLALIAGSWKPLTLVEEKLGDRKPVKITGKETRKLESFLVQAMRELQVPGAQVALVQDGQVVWHKSLGVAAKGPSQKITDQTLFMIGSTTKPLTTLLQARVVDQGKLKWGSPLKELLPNFALADAEAAQKIQLKHTACACTGMPRRDVDFIFEYDGISPEERLLSLAKMAPTTDFGETFQYSNLLVAAGGYAAAHKLHPTLKLEEAFERAMQEEVLDPLGMKHSRLRPKPNDLLAQPHALDFEAHMTAIPQKMDDTVYAVAPAGAAWSTATDLARYVLFELANGELDGQRLLSLKNVEERRTPGVKVDETARYGLGLFFDDVKGLKTWGHGGNTLGFTSDLVFLPEHQIGWVLLTNAGASPLRNIFQQYIFEVLYGAEPQARKRLTHTLSRLQEANSKMRQQVTRSSYRMKWVEKLVGQWHSDDLGHATISQDKRGFTADFGEWSAALGVLSDKNSPPTLVTISPPLAGSIALQLQTDGSLLLDAGQTKYTFKKVP